MDIPKTGETPSRRTGHLRFLLREERSGNTRQMAFFAPFVCANSVLRKYGVRRFHEHPQKWPRRDRNSDYRRRYKDGRSRFSPDTDRNMRNCTDDARTVRDYPQGSGSLRHGNELSRSRRRSSSYDVSQNGEHSGHFQDTNDTFQQHRGTKREIKTEEGRSAIPNKRNYNEFRGSDNFADTTGRRANILTLFLNKIIVPYNIKKNDPFSIILIGAFSYAYFLLGEV